VELITKLQEVCSIWSHFSLYNFQVVFRIWMNVMDGLRLVLQIGVLSIKLIVFKL
jgi:hypothetical protein